MKLQLGLGSLTLIAAACTTCFFASLEPALGSECGHLKEAMGNAEQVAKQKKEELEQKQDRLKQAQNISSDDPQISNLVRDLKLDVKSAKNEYLRAKLEVKERKDAYYDNCNW